MAPNNFPRIIEKILPIYSFGVSAPMNRQAPFAEIEVAAAGRGRSDYGQPPKWPSGSIQS
jgi:hypothetical protein